MNEKIKKALVWVGGVFAVVFAVLCGKWRRNLNNRRVQRVEDGIDSSRRTADDIRTGNKQIADTAEGISGTVSELTDRVCESQGTSERAGESVTDAHGSVKRGIEILEQAEKRSKQK